MIGKKKSQEEFLKELKAVHGNNIIPLEKYINIDTKLKFKCTIDNYEWYTTPYVILRGSGCPCCSGKICVEGINSVYKLKPKLIKYFKYIEDTKKHTIKSGKKIICRCPECGYEKKMKICNLVNYNFHCDYCSDKISFPNRFTSTLLKEIGIKFELEKSFQWSKNRRYDVYIPNYNDKSIIIENQGIQHKSGDFASLGGRNLKQEQENDKLKKQLAIENGIDIYIELFFYYHYYTLENLKKIIMNSKLRELFNLKTVNWNYILKESQKSIIPQIWNTWNNMNENVQSTVNIGKIYNIDRTTVAKYLKLGVDIGKVKYDPLEKQKTFKGRCGNKHPNSKKVVCLNTGEVFESCNLATKQYRVSVSKCCNKKELHSGRLKNGTKLVWRYYNEYINMSPKDIEECIILANCKDESKRIAINKTNKIVCLNTGKIFSCSLEASKYYNIKQYYNIELCCKGIYSTCGKSKNNNKLVWMFYNDYKNMNEIQISKAIDQAINCNKNANHYKTKKNNLFKY
ncbi:TPA: hypothetical protein PTV31_003190 [Clostridium botulinum]|nr:hypothetical protein [Clostridium botulinum]